jgi:uncharacterized membrane protein
MDRKLVLQLAAVSLLGHIAQVQSKEEKSVRARTRTAIEQCWGVAPAGQNQCGNIAGTHTCAGKSKVDNDPGEWTFVVKGSCKRMGGLNHEQATRLGAKSKEPRPAVKSVPANARK